MAEKPILRTTRKERVAFIIFMAGCGVFDQFIGSYLQLYLTNIGITAVTVGVLFIIVRTWDAINDPLFGLIVDRFKFKSGRFVPWLKTASFLLPIFTIFMFAIPSDLPYWFKVGWALLAFLLYDVGYTIGGVPIYSMTSAMTDQVWERTHLISRGTLFVALAALVLAIVGPQLYLNFGWLVAGIVIAVVGGLLLIWFPRVAQERYTNKDTSEVNLKSLANYIKGNRYLWIYFIALTVLNISATTQAIAPYVAEHCLGDPALVSILVLALVAPMLLAAAVVPALSKRFDRFHMLITFYAATGIISALSYFLGYSNPILFYSCLALKGICWGFVLVIQLTFTGDVIEYGEFTSGKRMQGITYAIQSFTFKLFNAIAAAGAMFILGFAGFVSGANVSQTPFTVDTIWFLFTLFPAIGICIGIPVMLLYKLRDQHVQTMARANSGEITREEALASLPQDLLQDIIKYDQKNPKSKS
ncbi:MAG: MFS transporter [Bifidobacteriaceae bacterium]|jgi:probable glucitol transport protein GutA|nr:MFS transporter [Bifidobacteriaceae bacterium]